MSFGCSFVCLCSPVKLNSTGHTVTQAVNWFRTSPSTQERVLRLSSSKGPNLSPHPAYMLQGPSPLPSKSARLFHKLCTFTASIFMPTVRQARKSHLPNTQHLLILFDSPGKSPFTMGSASDVLHGKACTCFGFQAGSQGQTSSQEFPQQCPHVPGEQKGWDGEGPCLRSLSP